MSPSMWFSRALSVVGAVALAVGVAVPAGAQQTGNVSGMVVSGNGQPLANAEVFVAGDLPAVAAAGRVRAATDEDGSYILSDIPAGRTTIRARLVGYSQQTAEVTVLAGQTTEVNFTLNRSVLALDEIVVTGAGGQVQKKQLGNTITTLDAAELEAAPIKDFSSAIQGREPSVVGMPTGGLAGQGSKIRIRGTNSLAMSNDPVIYIDGVRVDNGGGFAGNVGVNGGEPSRLDDINPESIERIEILKGAAAATLYGSEASSGVIQIFTKRGASGAPRFNFRIDQTLSQFDTDRVKPLAGSAVGVASQGITPAEMAQTLSELYDCQFLWTASDATGNSCLQPYEAFETDIIKDLMETGHGQVYSANVTGGAEDVQYYVAGRATFEDGPWGAEDLGPTKDFARQYQGNFSVTLFPRSRLQFRVNGMFSNRYQEVPENGNDIYSPAGMMWWVRPERGNCRLSSVSDTRFGDRSPYLCTGKGNEFGSATFGTIEEFSYTRTWEDTDHFQSGVTASYEASSAITVETIVGFDFVNSRASQLRPFGFNRDDFTGYRTDGNKEIGARRHQEITLDTKVRWNERFANDAVSSQLVIGGQGFISSEEVSGGNGIGFPGPGIAVAEAGASQSLDDVKIESVNAGLFAQEQVGFQDVVYVTGGLRFDRNSAFGEEEDAAVYPKGSISFIPSDLPGWNLPVVSTFRVRGAVGQSGLQPGAFDKLTTYQPATTTVGSGLRPENLGKPDLKPERTTEWEAGLELGLFENRVSLEGTWWSRDTKDALVARQFPVTGGFSNTQLDNVGLLEANGLEFKADWLALDREDVALSLFFNASYLSENVTTLSPAPPFKVAGTYPRPRNFVIEGYAPGSFFGAVLLPFCSTNPVYSGGPNAGSARPCYEPGQSVPYDTNGDGAPDTDAEFRNYLSTTGSISLDAAAMQPLIDDEDGDGDLLDHYLGKPTPDWQGAFGTQLTLWRNLQINTLFEYHVGDFVIQNMTDQFRNANPGIGRNTRSSAIVEGTLLNPASAADVDTRYDLAMQWATELKSLAPFSGLNATYPGKFLRWRELGITYTAPRAWQEALGLDNLQFAFTGRNLKAWTGYYGSDPESNSYGNCNEAAAFRNAARCNFSLSQDEMSLPLARSWGISVRFGF